MEKVEYAGTESGAEGANVRQRSGAAALPRGEFYFLEEYYVDVYIHSK